MTRPCTGLSVVLALSFTACIGPYGIHPVSGGRAATASNGALTLRVEPDAWRGNPPDLKGYLSPIAIDVVNLRSESVWISYADFALIDENGIRYRAVSPYAHRGDEPPKPAPAPARELERPSTAAPQESIPVDEDGALDDSWHDSVESSPDPEPARQEAPPPRPTVIHPYYGPNVQRWSEWYYPTAPSYDVIRLGLPEGVLPGGQRASGFVYFENATALTGRIDLTWTARTPEGTAVASLTVPMVVE
jgi:hypothetical protein